MTDGETGATAAPEIHPQKWLIDDWEDSNPIPLAGLLERSGIPSWLTVLVGLVIAFILFQGISLVVMLLLLAANDVALSDLTSGLEIILEQNARELIVANTIGQVFGLLIPALIFTGLHTTNRSGFLRFRGTDVRLVLLSVFGLIALIPVVQWIGVVSDSMPWPDFIREFEQAQTDLIERVLLQDFGLMFTLSMMALTPALCEEILFRGYIQRQAERSMGVWGGILFSGIIFGLYHLRITQALPLAMLGTYLAYLTWRSGSLVPAFIVHFANNAFAVFIGKYGAEIVGSEVDLQTFHFPWAVVVSAIVVLVGVTVVFHTVAKQMLHSRLSDSTRPGPVNAT